MFAGLIIAIFAGILLMGRSLLFKKVDDAVISTDDVPTLIKRAESMKSLGNYANAVNAYLKVLSLEPHNLIAASNLGDLGLSYIKTRQGIEMVLKVYESIYSYYYSNIHAKYNECSAEEKKSIAMMMFKYGKILHEIGRAEQANEIKKIALMNDDFVTSSIDFIKAAPY